jgi:thiamine pyrophosphate-dependent acetolactate synthase large subunit-like protein
MHPLYQNAQSRQLITQADVILGLEVTDFWGQVNQVNRNDKSSRLRIKPDARTITIDVNDLYMKSNYQDFQRYAPVDLSISGDGEASLPALIEAVREAMSSERRAALAPRLERFRVLHAQAWEASRQAAAFGWDASPVSTARLCMELWSALPRASSATGRTGCGTSTATTSTWESARAAAWATACPPRSARRSPTRRWGGSRSTSSATATSCTPTVRCGPRRTTACRCSR